VRRAREARTRGSGWGEFGGGGVGAGGRIRGSAARTGSAARREGLDWTGPRVAGGFLDFFRVR